MYTTVQTTGGRTVPPLRSEEQVLAVLRRSLGDDADAHWGAACCEVGLDPPRAPDIAAVVAVLEALAGRSGLIGIVALGQLIRARTSLRLSRKEPS